MDHTWITKLEKGLFVFAIIYLSGCLFGVVTGSQFVPTSIAAEINTEFSSPVISVIQWGIFAAVLMLTVLRWRIILPVILKRRCLWIIVILALCSIAWSRVPDLTMRRSIALFLTTLSGVYFGGRFTMKEQLQLLGWAFGILIAMNVVFVIAFPSYGLHTGVHQGAWRGLTSHKNGLAQLMTLSTLIFIALLNSVRQHRNFVAILLSISVLLVLLSTSKTALSIMLIVVFLAYFLRGLRLRSTVAFPIYFAAFLVVATLIVLVVGNFETIVGALGRNVTLTGRTEVWGVALEKFPQHFWGGYGYSAFWLRDQGDSIEVYYRMNWQAAHGHNGYIDMLLDLGVLGLSAFFGSFALSFRRATTWLKLHRTSEGLYPLLLCSFVLLYNLTESSLIVESTGMVWFMYVLVSTAMLVQPIPVHARFVALQPAYADRG